MTVEGSARMALRDRTRWHLGANTPVTAWLTALLAVAVLHRYIPESPWLLVHLLLLGAVSNAIFVWSSHFADALLRRRATAGSRRWQGARMVALNVGVLAVVAGMVGSAWILTLVGSVVVGGAAAAHAVTLALAARTALASRFGATVRYYVYASLALPIGAGLGATLARDPLEPWHGRLLVAHITLNLLGWIGLTVMGTLVTLWPTMLRTRIADGAERVARRGLPILVGSVIVGATGALAGLQALAAVGVAAYLGGILWAIRPLAQVTRAKTPSAYATWSVMAAMIWLMGSLLGLVMVLVTSQTWQLVTDRLGLLILPFAVGFAGQVLLGALSFLVPVVLGGGPAILRGTQARMDRASAFRAVLINVGLLVAVLPVPDQVRRLVLVVVLGAFAAFLPLLVIAVLFAVRARRVGPQSPIDQPSMPRYIPEPAAVAHRRHKAQAAVAVVLLLLVIGAGLLARDATLPLLAGGPGDLHTSGLACGRGITCAHRWADQPG
jgi:nitrite reductase (NO-forming)